MKLMFLGQLQTPLKPSTDRSVPSIRICFVHELANELRSLAKPFEPLLGGQPMKASVTVKLLGLTLRKCTLEFLAG